MSSPYATRLGDFLRASRARVQPEDVGLPPHGARRRVDGLRREELAVLAGVSPSYYTRLEQGQSRNASPQVLDALATALRLTAAERAHLGTLAAADHTRPAPDRSGAEVVDPSLAQLLDSLADVPALVMGRRTDVLAWNATGRALLAGHLPADGPEAERGRPNMAELVFLDGPTRELYRDHRAKAEAVVGNLRMVVAAHPHDAVLAGLISRLFARSPEFAALWSDNRIQPCATAEYRLHHPFLGEVTVLQQTLRSAAAPEQVLVTHTAPAGSPDADVLSLLPHWLDRAEQQDPAARAHR